MRGLFLGPADLSLTDATTALPLAAGVLGRDLPANDERPITCATLARRDDGTLVAHPSAAGLPMLVPLAAADCPWCARRTRRGCRRNSLRTG
jgi:hypothetical protein